MSGWGKKRTDQIVNLIEKRLEELDTWQGGCMKTKVRNNTSKASTVLSKLKQITNL